MPPCNMNHYLCPVTVAGEQEWLPASANCSKPNGSISTWSGVVGVGRTQLKTSQRYSHLSNETLLARR